MPGAARTTPAGRRALTPCSSGKKANAGWLRAKKTPPANISTSASSAAVPSGWRPPMGCFATPRSPGGAPPAVQQINSPIHCLAGDGAGRLWFVSGNGLHLVQNDHHQEFPLPAINPNNLPAARTLYALKNGMLLLVAGDQWFQLNPERGTFSNVLSKHPHAGPLKALGLLRDGRLCAQALSPGGPDQNLRLEAYDGTQFGPLSVPSPESTPGANLSTLFAAQNGDLWVSGDRGTAWYHDQKWRTFGSTDGSSPDSVVAFAEFADGRDLVRHPGQGLGIRRSELDRCARGVGPHQRDAWRPATAVCGWLPTADCIASSRARGSRTARKRASPAGAFAGSARISAAGSGRAPPTA